MPRDEQPRRPDPHPLALAFGIVVLVALAAFTYARRGWDGIPFLDAFGACFVLLAVWLFGLVTHGVVTKEPLGRTLPVLAYAIGLAAGAVALICRPEADLVLIGATAVGIALALVPMAWFDAPA